jgi:hypothetical protein
MVMGLLYRFNDIVKCVCYMSLGSNGCFVIGATLTSDHYRTYIISGVDYPRLDSIVPLVLCTVAYNFRGTIVILQVSQNNVNPAKNGNISGRPYMRVMTYKTLVFMHQNT